MSLRDDANHARAPCHPISGPSQGMHMLSAMSACDSSSEIDSGGSVSAPPRLLIHPVGDPRRQEVESFIRDIYADRYGADV